MGGMVDHTTLQTHHLGHTFPGPAVAAEAIGSGTAAHQGGQRCELIARESARGSGRGLVAYGPQAIQAGSLHPLADGGFADPQGFGDVAPGPALLREVPGLQAPGFFPRVRCRVQA